MLVRVQEKPVPVITFVVKERVAGGRGIRWRLGWRVVGWTIEEHYVTSAAIIIVALIDDLGSVFNFVFPVFLGSNNMLLVSLLGDSMLLVSLLVVQDCWKLHDIRAFIFTEPAHPGAIQFNPFRSAVQIAILDTI